MASRSSPFDATSVREVPLPRAPLVRVIAQLRFGEGVVFDEHGVEVARVSYNGRVWAPGPWVSGREPIMEAVEAG